MQRLTTAKQMAEYLARAFLILGNRLVEWTLGLSLAVLLLAAAWWLYHAI